MTPIKTASPSSESALILGLVLLWHKNRCTGYNRPLYLHCPTLTCERDNTRNRQDARTGLRAIHPSERNERSPWLSTLQATRGFLAP
ncbi:unnamed protein product [Pieris brassicae]|uniref:Uncharacterized protein n=1 Tax=Pieris brassicae TaxID=7116 RepID=A0A9P0TK02_PIEBR|nr:unnamed protein product [Pieris brassicae]